MLVYLVILFVLAVILQYIVSWAGNVVHSIGNEEISYAYFTFREVRNTPMTTNIMLNTFMPLVGMVFICCFAQKNDVAELQNKILWFPLFYYIWRMFVICVLLKRKELCSFTYELLVFFAGMLLAWGLKRFFLDTETVLLITAAELREELWFVIIIILYKLLKQILDKKVLQENILTKEHLKSYIVNRFKLFVGQYGYLIDFKADNYDQNVFIFAVMIFENFNRGSIARRVERIKFAVTGKASLGIMQYITERNISDEESVLLFQSWLIDHSDSNQEWNDCLVYELAYAYNHNTRYAEDVAYIYNELNQYIREIPKFRKMFCLEMSRDYGKLWENTEMVTVLGENITVEDFRKIRNECLARGRIIEAILENGKMSIDVGDLDIDLVHVLEESLCNYKGVKVICG